MEGPLTEIGSPDEGLDLFRMKVVLYPLFLKCNLHSSSEL